ncbi:MAG: hypothetical protein ABSA44_08455 [Bacteroidota bacterium]|jgi:hypothetical protein
MIEKPSKLRAAVLGGLIVGTISGLPGLNFLNCCCCAGILFGGAMAVYLYRQEFTNEMPPMESSDALVLGIMAGIIGALITTFLSAMVSLILGPVETEMVRNFLDKFGQKFENSGSLPPGTMDDLRDKLELAMKEGRTIGGILRSLVYALILYPIFSMLGGLIGFGIFGKKKPTVPPMPPMQQ